MTQCSVPTSVLLASPFNLPWGTSVWATVTATNIYGDSIVSEAGNGAIMLTYPDAPLNLADQPLYTSASKIVLSWQQGLANGGTPVIDYTLWYNQGSAINTWIVLADQLTLTEYEAALTMGTLYSFKVQSRNAFGHS